MPPGRVPGGDPVVVVANSEEPVVAENIKVVAHFLDGRLVKGTTADFVAHRPVFHLQPMDGGGAAVIRCDELKAIFFVKDYAGYPGRKDIRGFIDAPSENVHGRKVAVSFKDGELFCGYSLAFSAERAGFFVFPADPESNNLRVFVMLKAAKEVKAGPAAEALARRVIDKPQAA